jgi:hypothetical protein
MVIWHCEEMVCEEDMDFHGTKGLHRSHVNLQRSLSTAIPTSRVANFSHYHDLASRFSTRSLTFPEDRLGAFSGILGALCLQFRSGFHFGLPEDFLDLALLWSTSKDATRIQYLPSWSWVGWTGKMQVADSRHMQNLLGTKERTLRQRLHPSMAMHSVTQLYKKPVGSTKLAQLSNAFHEWEEAAKDQLAVLPKGWHKENRPAVMNKPPLDEEYIETLLVDMFWHDDHPAPLYRYPIPLVNDTEKGSIADHKWEPFLFFKAQRSHFYFQTCRARQMYLLKASDATKQVVGDLRCDSNDALEEQVTVELIAISRTDMGNEYREEALNHRLARHTSRFNHLDADDDVYNVLSIEWDQGIAYRTGLGRVVKAAWEAHEHDEIDVKLG